MSMDEGFVELVNRHRPMLERICRIYEHGAEERRDLFQEIVYQLWRSYPSFRGEAQAHTWMYRVALNTAITVLRQQRARPTLVALETDPRATPARGDSETLYQAVSRLNKVDRAVVALYLEGFDYREIAGALGLTETNVGAKLSRIRTKLQGLVQGTE